MEGAGERLRRVVPAAQPGQPREQEVDLELRARRAWSSRPAPRRAGSAAPTARRWTARGRPRRCACASPSCQVTSAAVGVGSDRADAGAGEDLGAARGGRAQQRGGDRAHAADGHPPLAGAVADQVVEEAAVLHQRRVVQVGEGADQGVGRDHAAHEVVGEALLDRPRRAGRSTTRPRSPGRPARAVARAVAAARVSVGATARGEARRPRRRTAARRRTPRRRRSARGTTAGSPRPRRARRRGRSGGRRGRSGEYDAVRRERRSSGRSRSRDDLLGQQRDEVGVAREPGRRGPGRPRC